ncbi:hypothetical protein B0T17DRAFT_509314 [Bombardia bombarda]|uniref:Collagen-like protein n=1 Tax=Bombardia bombarda TaxID=252184 RepID=A0AA39WUW7_9PEZI|nr:hypothetical protein B0T17DRAFT_509314 [Bombardia bombarda]
MVVAALGILLTGVLHFFFRATGPPGPQGEKGDTGKDGKDGRKGDQGPPGKDADPAAVQTVVIDAATINAIANAFAAALAQSFPATAPVPAVAPHLEELFRRASQGAQDAVARLAEVEAWLTSPAADPAPPAPPVPPAPHPLLLMRPQDTPGKRRPRPPVDEGAGDPPKGSAPLQWTTPL